MQQKPSKSGGFSLSSMKPQTLPRCFLCFLNSKIKYNTLSGIFAKYSYKFTIQKEKRVSLPQVHVLYMNTYARSLH